MNRADLLEKLSALEHEQWEEWSKEVADEVSEERRARWETSWVPYDQLDDGTKDLDREWAEKVLELLEPYLMNDEQEVGPPEEEEIEIEEMPEEGKAEPALEMVTKLEVDATQYPSIAAVLGCTMLSNICSKKD